MCASSTHRLSRGTCASMASTTTVSAPLFGGLGCGEQPVQMFPPHLFSPGPLDNGMALFYIGYYVGMRSVVAGGCRSAAAGLCSAAQSSSRYAHDLDLQVPSAHLTRALTRAMICCMRMTRVAMPMQATA